MYFGMLDPTFIILIPAIIFSMYAQGKVNRAYNTYLQVRNNRGYTGAQAARDILDKNGLQDIPIQLTEGRLSDHYDPRSKVMRLSPEVYNTASVAAVSIAAHESGHAIQHNKGYTFLKIRNAIAPVVSVVSNLSWPLMIIGIIVISMGKLTTGNLIFNIGIFFFVGVVIFHTITLPVELDASSRAIKQLESLGIIDYDERGGAKKVLSAAAMTYVAALAVAVVNLIRILLIRGRQ